MAACGRTARRSRSLSTFGLAEVPELLGADRQLAVCDLGWAEARVTEAQCALGARRGTFPGRSHNGCAVLAFVDTETDTNRLGHQRIDADPDVLRKPGQRQHQTIWPDMACKRSGVRLPLAPQVRHYMDLDKDQRTAKLTAKFMIAG